MLDPDDYVITRKRKRYRFALFHNSPLCFETDDWRKNDWADVIEVGAGTAFFSVELAERTPDKNFVAVDIKSDRLQKGARLAEEKGLKNVRFLRAPADQLLELFEPRSVEGLWLTFPDPLPKKSSSRRRLTHPAFLAIYQALLKEGGALYLKHDSRDFFDWSLKQLVTQKWILDELSYDLHESGLSDAYTIMTTFEKRWLSDGSLIRFVKARQVVAWIYQTSYNLSQI